jgi:hypothetical protein
MAAEDRRPEPGRFEELLRLVNQLFDSIHVVSTAAKDAKSSNDPLAFALAVRAVGEDMTRLGPLAVELADLVIDEEQRRM